MTFVSIQILVTQLQNEETGVIVEGIRELASPLKGDFEDSSSYREDYY